MRCITPPLLCPGSPKRKSASRASFLKAHTQPLSITKKRKTKVKRKEKHYTTLVQQLAKVNGRFLSNPSQQATARKVSFCKDPSSALMFDAAPSEYHHHDHVVSFISKDEKQNSCNLMHNDANSCSDCCGVEIHLITPLLSLMSKSCNSSESIETMSCSDDNTDESYVVCPEVYPRFMDHVVLQLNTIPFFNI